MIKYQSRSHYTLMQIRSGNNAKTEAELVEMSNQKPSTIKRSIAVLLRNGLIEEVEITRIYTYGHQRGQSYTVTGYTVTPKGVEMLYYLARNQKQNPHETDYNYEHMLRRQRNRRKKVTV